MTSLLTPGLHLSGLNRDRWISWIYSEYGILERAWGTDWSSYAEVNYLTCGGVIHLCACLVLEIRTLICPLRQQLEMQTTWGPIQQLQKVPKPVQLFVHLDKCASKYLWAGTVNIWVAVVRAEKAQMSKRILKQNGLHLPCACNTSRRWNSYSGTWPWRRPFIILGKAQPVCPRKDACTCALVEKPHVFDTYWRRRSIYLQNFHWEDYLHKIRKWSVSLVQSIVPCLVSYTWGQD